MDFSRRFPDFNDIDLDGEEPAPGEKAAKPPPSPLAFTLAAWDAADSYAGEAPPQEWLIGHVLPRKTAGLIVAAGDTGKSFTALELCLRVTRGPLGGTSLELPILGGLVASYGAAAFVTAEDGRGAVHRRIRALDPDGKRQAKREHPLFVVPLPDAGGPFPIVAEERGKVVATPQFAALREQLRTIPDLALVVLDPLQTFVHADINADPMAAALTMSLLNMVAAETGATVLASHHVRKEREAPKTAAEARLLIRGSSALVDQSRFAIVLWTPDEPEVRKVCKALDAHFAPNAVVYGAVVKSNDGASREKWVCLRGTDGNLRDVTHALRARRAPPAELLESLVEGIGTAAKEGRPYTKTGVNGLFERRAELGVQFADVSKHQLAKIIDDLMQAGGIVAALASGTTVKWLDVPDGPFALGEGAFAAGASTAKGGRKGFGNAR
jgi:hypothetical protein